MLDDKDRIFRNLYGVHDWGLEGARSRGAWDGTKAILDKGRDWVVNQSETVERLGKSRNSVHGRRSLAKPRHL